MVTATITSKGQITIPKDVRTSLHLHAGDRVAFVVHGNSEAVLTPITRSVDDVYGKLHKIIVHGFFNCPHDHLPYGVPQRA